MEKVLFSEEQRFNQWWIWTILLVTLMAVVVPFAYGIYSQEVLGKPFGDEPMSTSGLIATGVISLIIMIVVILVFASSRLKTKITHEGIFVAYPPFFRNWKKISPEELDRYEIRTYRAKWEYGGYGMRRRLKAGKAYIISGNIGLQLYFKNGKKLLVGTQKKQALEYAMNKLMQEERLD